MKEKCMNQRKKLLKTVCNLFLSISFILTSAFINITDKYVVDIPEGMVYVEEGMSTVGAKDDDLDAKSTETDS